MVARPLPRAEGAARAAPGRVMVSRARRRFPRAALARAWGDPAREIPPRDPAKSRGGQSPLMDGEG